MFNWVWSVSSPSAKTNKNICTHTRLLFDQFLPHRLHPLAVGTHRPLVCGIGDQGQHAINAD